MKKTNRIKRLSDVRREKERLRARMDLIEQEMSGSFHEVTSEAKSLFWQNIVLPLGIAGIGGTVFSWFHKEKKEEPEKKGFNWKEWLPVILSVAAEGWSLYRDSQDGNYHEEPAKQNGGVPVETPL